MIRNPTVHSIACFLAFSSYGVSGTTSGVALMVVWDLKKKRRGNNKQGWASGKREGWGLSKYTLTSSQACITYCVIVVLVIQKVGQIQSTAAELKHGKNVLAVGLGALHSLSLSSLTTNNKKKLNRAQ